MRQPFPTLVMRSFGHFTYFLGMSQNIDAVSHPTASANMLPILKRCISPPFPPPCADPPMQLPNAFDDFASQHYGKKQIPSDFMSYCHRELTHEQWKLLLDDEFLHAYEHCLPTKCCDGIKRQFYPRILTYSCDYKEKW